MPKFELNRTKQCAKCPWKVSTDPKDIPDGYSEEQHKNLEGTIAPNGVPVFPKTMRVMACHHSKEGEEEYCVGWLNQQLGNGNNIALRMKMRNCENIKKLKVYGPQHTNFKDTLPENKRKK